tara:strand:+ start:915 stop:1184 length:270 start_codon:yes stop_codon:yes gene_type:complete
MPKKPQNDDEDAAEPQILMEEEDEDDYDSEGEKEGFTVGNPMDMLNGEWGMIIIVVIAILVLFGLYYFTDLGNMLPSLGFGSSNEIKAD